MNMSTTDKPVRSVTSTAFLTTGTAAQLFKYFVVGGTAALVDWSLYWMLVSAAGMNYLLSAFISFSVAAFLNYALCMSWVFNEHRYRRSVEAGLTLAVSLIGLLLNQFFLYAFHDLLAFHFMISKIGATGIVFFWNFFGRKYFIFRSPAEKRPGDFEG